MAEDEAVEVVLADCYSDAAASSQFLAVTSVFQ